MVDVKACTDADVLLAITRDAVRRPVAEGMMTLLLEWPEQVEYERIRPALVSSASEGAVTSPAGFRP
jgi:lactate dehydrogenase-like 2-hydroxyacid dehydrogenase